MADDVNLKIAIDAEAAAKSLESLEKNSIKSIKNMESAFNGLKTVAVAAVGFIAARGVLDFFEEGVKGAIAQEQAFARLEAQMIATGENSEEAAKAFNDLAGELESTTKFGDDAVLSAAALAKSYGLTNQQALELTRTAADLASATGVELEAAVEQLTASYSGNVKALGKLVPEVKGLTKEQLAAGEAVAILGKRFQGAANKEIQTYAGAVKQASNSFENFRESFGTLITQNKTIVAVINGVGKVFQNLQKIVEDNQESFTNLINFGIRAAIVGINLLVEAIRGLVLAFGAVAETASRVTATVFQAFADIAKSVEKVTGETGLVEFFESGAKSSDEFADDTLAAVAKIDGVMSDITAAVDEFSVSVFEAGETSDKSMSKAEKSTASFGRTVVKSADDIAKLRDEGQKFLADLNKSGASEIQKVVLDAEEAQKKLGELVKSGALTANEAREASFKLTQNQILKEIELRDKANKQLIEDAKKAADEAKARIASIAADPITFTVKAAEIQPLDISQQAKDASALSVGFISKILDGAAGAKSLISAGAGAFADSLLPGIGGAVGGLISKLAEGPEATKKFVKEFVAAIPQIVDAIAESAPVFVESLIDVLVNKGGAVKIGIAIARAMSGEAILKNIGKQIGVSFGSSFNADVLGGKIAQGFLAAGASIGGVGLLIASKFRAGISKAIREIVETFENIGGRISATFINAGKIFFNNAVFGGAVRIGQAISSAFQTGIKNLVPLFENLGQAIVNRFVSGFSAVAQLFQPVIDALRFGFSELPAQLLTAINAILQPIKDFLNSNFSEAISGAISAIVKAFTDIFDLFSVGFPDIISSAFQPIIDFFNSFEIKAPSLPGSGGGGLISGTGTPLDYFANGGVVYAANGFKPRGTDTVPAMLTPGEMVLNRGQQSQLFDLANSGGSEVSGLLETLIGLMSQPMTTEVSAEVNGKAIADIVLQQSRQRARLSV